MAKVKVDITADGSGFHRVMGGIGSSVKGFASSMKTQLAAAFSVATIGILTKQMIDFGDEIRNMANDFDMSTDAVQRYRWAMRDAGIEAGSLTKMLQGLEEARGKAIGEGGEKEKSLMKKLGFTDEDLKTLPKDKLFDKLMSSNMPRQVVENTLDQLGVPRKTAAKFMGARDSGWAESMKNAPVVAQSNIDKLDALGDAFSKIKDAIMKALIPVLLSLAKIIVDWVIPKFEALGAMEEGATFLKKMDDAARSLGITPDLEKVYSPDMVAQILKTRSSQQAGESDAAYAARIRAEEIELAKMAEKRYGSLENAGKVLSEYNKNPVKPRDPNDKTFIQNIRDILKEVQLQMQPQPGDPDFIGPVQAKQEAPFVATAIDQKKQMLGALGGGDLLRIGNALGIDVQYRMQRLAMKQVDLLGEISANTLAMVNKLGANPSQMYPPAQ